ncbi:hypothetical protein JCM24511_05682 [Saitozyma sp. JCM 24511]|nr:hypothetical protein JCM24511_05682 [Saitozyma sp. JCM 24511]
MFREPNHSPIHEETTDTVVPLVHRDAVSGLVELVRRGETCRAGPDDGDALASAVSRGTGLHPAHLEALVNDGALDRLDTDGGLVDAEDTGRLAWRRADTAGELGEVVGLEKTVEGVEPSVLEHHRVPLGDDVGDGTTRVGLTEGDTAVHAASRLVLELAVGETARDLLPVLDPLAGRAVGLVEPLVLHEPAGLVELGETLLGGALVDHGVLDVDDLGLGSLVLGRLVRGDELGRGYGQRVGVLGKSRVKASGDEVDLGSGLGRDEVDDRLSLLLLGGTLGLLLEHTLVVERHDSDKHGEEVVEVAQDAVRELGTSVVAVVLDHRAELGDLLGVVDRTQLDSALVDLGRETVREVEDVGDTARHTRGKVAPGETENDDTTTGHVLATVVTGTLDDEACTRVSDGETLSGDTADKGLTRGGTKEADVADDDVLLGLEGGGLWRVHDEATARETLADVVVGVTLELDGDTGREEGAERLTGGALHVDVDGVARETGLSVLLGNVVRQGRAERAVRVDDVAVDLHGETLGDGRLGLVDEFVVETDVQLVVLGTDSVSGHIGAHEVSRLENRRQVEVLGLGRTESLVHTEVIGATDHLVDGAETELGHDGTKLLDDIVEKVDDLLRLASKFGTERGVLRGDTDGAGVLVASLHHDAAHGDERGGGETPLLGTEERRNGNVATGPDLTVGLDGHTATEVVENQRLVGLGETELPGETGVLDRSPLGSTGTTVVTRDGDVVGLGLGNTRRDDADADLGDELDGHAGAGVGRLEVVDELLQVLDRVNVVVRRGRHEGDTGGRVTGATDRRRHLVAGKLTTLSGLGTLGHLDLELVGIGEVVGSDTETTRGDLLDGRSARVPNGLELHGVGEGLTVLVCAGPGDRDGSLGILTTFSSVGLAAETVHRDGEGGVRLHGNRTVRHGTGDASAHNLVPRLDLVNRHRSGLVKVELEETTESGTLDRLARVARVAVIGVLVLLADSVLELGHGDRVVDTHLGSLAVVILARLGHAGDLDSVAGWPGALVELERVHGEELEGRTLDTRCGADKALADDLLVDTENLKELSALVRGQSGHTHLGEHLENTLVDRLHVVCDELLGALAVLGETLTRDLVNHLHDEPGADGVRAVADKHAGMVHLASLARLDHDGDVGTLLLLDEVVVNTTGSKDGGERDSVGAGGAVRQNDDLEAGVDGVDRLLTDAVEGVAVTGETLGLVESDVNGDGRPVRVGHLHVLDGVHLLDGEDGRLEVETVALVRAHLEEVALLADHGLEGHDDRLSDRVDRGVGDLGEQLTEVVVHCARGGGHARNGSVVTHRTERLVTLLDHGQHEHAELLDGVTKGEELGVGAEGFVVELDGDGFVASHAADDLGKLDDLRFDPRGEGLPAGGGELELPVVDDATLLGVDEEHASGLEAALLDDLLGLNGDSADLRGTDHDVVGRDDESARTKTVTVEVGTAEATVGEGEEGGTVPRLHEAPCPSVKGLLLGLHEVVVLPSLGDHHHDSLGQGEDTVDNEELKHVVKRGRVGTARLDDRVEQVELVLEVLRLEVTLARAHPVLVAPDGVDLTVVSGPSHGLRTVPRGEGVSGETRVDEGKVRGVESVVQVVVVVVHLDGGELTLVDDVGRGEGADVKALLDAHLVGGLLAEDIELTEEELFVKAALLTLLPGTIVRVEDDERLDDLGLLGLGGRAEDRVVGRDVTPAEDSEAEHAGNLLERGLLRGKVLGREEHVSDGVMTLGGEGGRERVGALANEKVVGDASHHTCTITIAGIGTGCTSRQRGSRRALIGHNDAGPGRD